jgi:hypothetical protein
MTGIQLAMAPTGSISGRIYDSDGEPLGKAQVQALRAIYKDGRRTLTSVQTVETNDRGEYRLFWLAPGSYYVAAMPDIPEVRGMQPGSTGTPTVSVGEPSRFSSNERATMPAIRKRRLQGGGIMEETFVPVYYPGVADSQSAVAVALAASANIGGVDVSVAAGTVPSRHIRGRVIDATTGQPAAGVAVMAIPVGRGPTITIPGGASDGSGAFDISGATPGTYVVSARANQTSGLLTIEVGDADVQNLAIVIRPSFTIQGKFIVDGRSRSKLESRISDLRIAQFVREPNLFGLPGGGPSFSPPPQPDGAFRLDGVEAGDFRVTLRALPPDAYVKSMRLGNADVLDAGLHLNGPPDSPLEIVIGTDAGRLSGVVLDARRETLPNRTVVLVPDARVRHRPDLYRNVTTDSAGRFTMPGIAPGTYQLFAWEDVQAGAWRDSEIRRPYDGRGKSIQVTEGSDENVQVTVIP